MELEEEVPETPPALRACCLQSEGGDIREESVYGYLEVDTEDGLAICHVVPILVQEDKALVAVPAPAWSKVASGRYLPKGTLSKAILLEVAAVEEGIEGLGGESVKIWMGYLNAGPRRVFRWEKPRSQGRWALAKWATRRCLLQRLC